MIRYVAYRKAVLAGMAGAVAWEAVARPLILAGVPYFDIVGTLGTLALPHAPAWAWWTAGMSLHLLVGAIWAVFYAYFFWSVLPLPPVLQGFLFAFVPMPLALFIMHPQFELMHPLVLGGELPYSGLFGLSDGWHEPLAIVAGHFIWGSVLGLAYVRPVGYATKRPPGFKLARVKPAHPAAPARALPADRFMFATGVECSYPTLDQGRWRFDEMAACGHYRYWRVDLALVRELGLRYLRYGPPLHLISPRRGHYDWAFLDDVAAEMQRLGITPIMDLCHFGVPVSRVSTPETDFGLRNGGFLAHRSA